MNDYCNVFTAYFINDKHCFNKLTNNNFKLQDLFSRLKNIISQLTHWHTSFLNMAQP